MWYKQLIHGSCKKQVWYSSVDIWNTYSKNEYENFVTAHMEAECIPTKPRAKMYSIAVRGKRDIKEVLLDKKNSTNANAHKLKVQRTDTDQKE